MSPLGHTWQGRAILHVDMDAFFASVEQLDHPEWRGRPVIVGGAKEGRGVVSAASYEARRFGVRSAMPSAQAARLCPDAIWARPRFDRYGELSRSVCEIFRSVTPRVEQVSIDEAYLDVTPTRNQPIDPVEVAREVSARVDGLGLSCSVGVATSKTVAKIASDFDKPHGITVVHPGEEASFLSPLPVSRIPGVGGATDERLRSVGIRTVGDLAALDEDTARQLLGSGGPELVRRAAGRDDREVAPAEGVKSISSEHTFAIDVREASDVDAALTKLVRRVAARLRRKGLAGRTLIVKFRYADFTTRTSSRTLPDPVDLDDELLDVALALVHQSWSPGTGLRLLGFGVSNFSEPACQLGLFGGYETRTEARLRALGRSLDDIRDRFGSDAIAYGGDVAPPHDGDKE